MGPAPAEVRAARAFLRGQVKAGTQDIPPRRFAAAAKELKLSFKDTLAVLARYYAGGQNAEVERQRAIREQASK